MLQERAGLVLLKGLSACIQVGSRTWAGRKASSAHCSTSVRLQTAMCQKPASLWLEARCVQLTCSALSSSLVSIAAVCALSTVAIIWLNILYASGRRDAGSELGLLAHCDLFRVRFEALERRAWLNDVRNSLLHHLDLQAVCRLSPCMRQHAPHSTSTQHSVLGRVCRLRLQRASGANTLARIVALILTSCTPYCSCKLCLYISSISRLRKYTNARCRPWQ